LQHDLRSCRIIYISSIKQKSKTKINGLGFVVTGIIAIIVIGVMIGVSGGNSSKSSDNISVWVEAEDIVKDNLKSPSTADFPASGNINEIDNNTFKVNSYVDSENSFGAKIRSDFSVTIIKDGDNYSYKDLSIQGD